MDKQSSKPSSQAKLSGFNQFYKGVFKEEHQHPLTIFLHVFGTIAGLLWLVLMPLIGMWHLIILFPVVHAVPGLIGHRIAERNKSVGDLRVTRKDFPLNWFIAANHLMLWDILFGRKLQPK